MGNKSVITFEGSMLAAIHGFLSSLKLSGRASRGRSKIINAIEDKVQEINDERKSLQEKHMVLDDDGNPKTYKEDNPDKGIYAGQYVYIDQKHEETFSKEVNEIANDKYDMNLIEHLRLISHLKSALDDYDQGMENQDAYLYDILLDELEKMDLTQN